MTSSRCSSPIRPWRSATTLCLWIVSRFSWRARTNASGAQAGELVDRHAHHLAHAVLDEARAPVRLLHDLDLVRALHQLVDLGAHRRLDDLQQRLGLDAVRRSPRGSRRRACRCRAGCAWRPGRTRTRWAISCLAEALLLEPLARALGHHLLRARARGHALGLDADQAARAAARRDRRPEQRVDLLGRRAGRRARACARGSARRSSPRRAARPGGRARARRCAAASVSALKASPRTTSSIASFTTSSKRDMCAPFCSGPRSTKHSSSA